MVLIGSYNGRKAINIRFHRKGIDTFYFVNDWLFNAIKFFNLYKFDFLEPVIDLLSNEKEVNEDFYREITEYTIDEQKSKCCYCTHLVVPQKNKLMCNLNKCNIAEEPLSETLRYEFE